MWRNERISGSISVEHMNNAAMSNATPLAQQTRVVRLLNEPYASMKPEHLRLHWAKGKQMTLYPEVEERYCAPSHVDPILRGQFTLNGETHTLQRHFDWRTNPSADLEWQILLHKFYYGVGLAKRFSQTNNLAFLQRFEELVLSWIRSTPAGYIATDVTARRVQSWIYAYYYFAVVKRTDQMSETFWDLFICSLHEQVEYIIEHIAPSRNHRTMALYSVFLVALAFPEYKRAAAWKQFAMQELEANINNDILADGVHCEASTDYHHIVLKNYLLAYRLMLRNGLEASANFRQKIIRALEFAMHIHRPDGLIPAVSDGDSTSFLHLLKIGADLFDRDDMRFVATQGQRGAKPQLRCATFTASGYYVQRSNWVSGDAFKRGHYLLFDCGPLGEGNHGHLDALSIEVAALGKALIVDPGRYTYDESGDFNWRALFRGTSYHNTVQVDGKNQAKYEFSGKRFKISRPHPRCTLLESSSGEVDYLHGKVVSAEYDAVHHRHILFVDQQYWIICDLLESTTEHEYALHYHLSPAAQGETRISASEYSCYVDSPGLRLVQPKGYSTRIQPGYVSTEYGSKKSAPIVRSDQQGHTLSFITLALPHQNKVSPQVDIIPGDSPGLFFIHHSLPGFPCVDTVCINNHSVTFKTPQLRFRGTSFFYRSNSKGHVLQEWLSRDSHLQIEDDACR